MSAAQGRQRRAIPKATCVEGLCLHLPGGLVCKGCCYCLDLRAACLHFGEQYLASLRFAKKDSLQFSQILFVDVLLALWALAAHSSEQTMCFTTFLPARQKTGRSQILHRYSEKDCLL